MVRPVGYTVVSGAPLGSQQQAGMAQQNFGTSMSPLLQTLFVLMLFVLLSVVPK